MRRIGILTIQSANNCGCVLQCMALKTKISELFPNDSVEVVNYVMPGSRRKLDADEEKMNQRLEIFEDFRLKYYNRRTDELFGEFEIEDLDYDIYVVGSDQVWNYYLAKQAEEVFFLNSKKINVKKISYAASTGGTETNYEYNEWYQNGLSGFEHISVRESSAAENLAVILNKNVSSCVDPTMLFNKEYWSTIERKPEGIGDKPYVFMYGLGYSWCKTEEEQACRMTNEIANEYGLDIVHYYYGDYKKRFPESAKCCYFNSPEEFLWLVHHAEYMIVCSFHGTVFSTLFERPFYTFKVGNNGTRMRDLTQLLGIGDRYIDCALNKEQWNWDIDWEMVRNRIEVNRESSIEYLKKALKD